MTQICDGIKTKQEVIDETLEEYREVFMKTRQEFATFVAVRFLDLNGACEVLMELGCSASVVISRAGMGEATTRAGTGMVEQVVEEVVEVGVKAGTGEEGEVAVEEEGTGVVEGEGDKPGEGEVEEVSLAELRGEQNEGPLGVQLEVEQREGEAEVLLLLDDDRIPTTTRMVRPSSLSPPMLFVLMCSCCRGRLPRSSQRRRCDPLVQLR